MMVESITNIINAPDAADDIKSNNIFFIHTPLIDNNDIYVNVFGRDGLGETLFPDLP